ncbi:MAG: hypothetical protein AAFP19_26735, partial [Bacteroidota bacterium]
MGNIPKKVKGTTGVFAQLFSYHLLSYLWRFLRYGLLLFLLYVVIVLVHGTQTDFQPQAATVLTIENPQPIAPIADSTLRFFIWNLGYGGLGAKCNFFYSGGGSFLSGGKMVRPPKAIVDENIAGATNILGKQKVDFYLLQEVDKNSKRSYYINQYQQHNQTTGGWPATYASNYKVAAVPIPLLEPWKRYGKTESGLATFSRYMPQSAQRLQLPGDYGWPTRIFQLDRCLALSLSFMGKRETA